MHLSMLSPTPKYGEGGDLIKWKVKFPYLGVNYQVKSPPYEVGIGRGFDKQRVVKTEATVAKVHEVLRFYHVCSRASRIKLL